MSREPGVSDGIHGGAVDIEGGEAAGRDLWPADARDLSIVRAEVMPGQEVGIVEHSATASNSVRDASDVDRPDGARNEMSVYMGRTRVVIQLANRASSRSSGRRQRTSPSESMHTDGDGQNGAGPRIEIVHRAEPSPDEALHFTRRDELTVPWQDAPVTLWTGPATGDGSPAHGPRPEVEISLPRVMSDPMDDPLNSEQPSGTEDSGTADAEVGEELRIEIPHNEEGDPVRFRSVWDTAVWHADEPLGANGHRPSAWHEVPRVHAGARSAQLGEQEAAGMEAERASDDSSAAQVTSKSSVPSDHAKNSAHGWRRVILFLLVTACIAAAVYGGSVIASRVLGNGEPGAEVARENGPDAPIRNVEATGNGAIGTFQVSGPWSISWAAQDGALRIQVVEVDGQRTTVVEASGPDAGVVDIDRSGTFSLGVRADGAWSVSVLPGATSPR